MESRAAGPLPPLLLVCALFFLGALAPAAVARPFLGVPPKPGHEDVVRTARWLVEQNTWGVLSTISIELKGAPFGNVVSFSDGFPNQGQGIPFFYLTLLDPTARNALADQRASFTVSEYPLGTCGKIDPENPTCAKLTLNGKLRLIDSKSKEAEFAQSVLFSKHDEMKYWPKDHNFQTFKLDIEDIFLIDWFGGAKPISVADYLKAKVSSFQSMLSGSI